MVSEALIARCIREEPKAQYELYRVLHGLMMSVCKRYERNEQDAVACMNQGYLKVLKNLKKRRPEVPFELWVRRIMINTMIDAFRKNKERKAHEKMETPIEESRSSEVNEYLKQMESEAFAQLLDRVPDMSRKVFNLFVMDGFSHSEIAELLGISAGTSKWHVSHARQVLQQAISQLAGRSTVNTATL
ncbi:MAG: sigma-70 family RNA polymerase sigma factor [Flavobacteriales bacterium]|nr:sigma-70 family RNA polymerase sigma factor [Flavobacteriales bacterium]